MAVNIWGDRASGLRAFNALPEEQRKAALAYAGGIVSGPGSAAEVNRTLRSGQAHPNAELIDKALHSARTAGPTTLWRGRDYYYGADARPDFKVGGTIEDRAFGSASDSRKVAMDYATDGKLRKRGGVLFRIELPAGHPALPMPNTTGDRQVGMFHDEREVLLPRGSQFEITAVSKPNKANVVQVTLRPKTAAGDVTNEAPTLRPMMGEINAVQHEPDIERTLPPGYAAIRYGGYGNRLGIVGPGGRQRDLYHEQGPDKIRAAVGEMAAEVKAAKGGQTVIPEAKLRAALDGFEHNGFRTHVMHVAPLEGGAVEVEIGVTKDGKQVGYIVHDFMREADGSLTAYINQVDIAPQYQGQGFTSAFDKHAMQQYGTLGIKQIALDATHAGRYAWAKAGFNMRSVKDIASWADHSLEGLKNSRRADALYNARPEAERKAFEAKLPRERETNPHPPPYSFEVVVPKDGYKTMQDIANAPNGIGKDFLLSAGDWRGTRPVAAGRSDNVPS